MSPVQKNVPFFSGKNTTVGALFLVEIGVYRRFTESGGFGKDSAFEKRRVFARAVFQKCGSAVVKITKFNRLYSGTTART